LCNDDFSNLVTNPLIEIPEPAEGEYRIYVGTYRQASPFGPGFLVMTAGPTDPATFNLSGLLPVAAGLPAKRLPHDVLLVGRNPRNRDASVDLSAGFEPVTAEITGGGSLPAFNIDLGNPTCTGFISALPNYVFIFTGDPQDARVFFEGDSDSTLVLIGPNGQAYCSDDVSTDNLNPVVDLPVAEGRYVVFIGSNDPAEDVSGVLTITGDTDAEPAALEPAEQSQ
jgi:hypothetical protein